MEEYMSGDQLREYLHMSKRKVKYLLENGFIPCVDTGKKTHRYLITYTDAKSFRKKLKANPNMLRSLEGCFSSRSTTPNKERLTQEEAIEFKGNTAQMPIKKAGIAGDVPDIKLCVENLCVFAICSRQIRPPGKACQPESGSQVRTSYSVLRSVFAGLGIVSFDT